MLGHKMKALPGAARSPTARFAPPAPSRRAGWPVSVVAKAEQAAVQTATAFDFGINKVRGPRPTMEDFLRLEHGLPGGFTYAAVLDGHGGALSAQWLDDELFKAVAEKVDASFLEAGEEAPPAPGSVARDQLPAVRWPARAGEVLEGVFKEVDARLVDFLRTEFGLGVTGVSGSTALVALIHPKKALFASLGDCMAVVCRKGAPVKATQQHRVFGSGPDVGEEVARVTSTGAWVRDGRVCNVLAVSRAFGDPEFKGVGLRTLLREGARKGMWTQQFADTHKFTGDPVIVRPDVTEIEFLPGDEFLLMATDGLWDCMPVADAVAFARKQFAKGYDAQRVAEAMTSVALKRYTADNTGVIVVDLRGPGGAGSAGGGGGAKAGGGGNGNGRGGGMFGGLFGGR